MSMPQNGHYQQNQFQGYQQPYYGYPQQTRPTIPCRMIANENEISPNEIPNNGSVGVFISSDYSYILLKSWNPDGTIRTTKLVPYEEEANAENTTEETLNAILMTLNCIEKAITTRQSKKSKEDSPNGCDKQFRNESNK